MDHKTILISVVLLGSAVLVFGDIKGSKARQQTSFFQMPHKLRMKREADIFGAGAAILVDKALEAQQIIEHGIKLEDKGKKEIDFFGVKFDHDSNSKTGYGDAMKKEEESRRRKRSEADEMNPQNGTEDDNIFKRLWRKMVEAAKHIAKKITSEMGSEQPPQEENYNAPQDDRRQ